jgi:hypothetical protein
LLEFTLIVTQQAVGENVSLELGSLSKSTVLRGVEIATLCIIKIIKVFSTMVGRLIIYHHFELFGVKNLLALLVDNWIKNSWVLGRYLTLTHSTILRLFNRLLFF